MTDRILVIDDSRAIDNVVGDLPGHGFEISTAPDVLEGLRLAYERKPEAALVGLDVPGLGEYTACRLIANVLRIPTLIVGPESRRSDLIGELDLGADDFITRPVAPLELAARIRALVRELRSAPPSASSLLRSGDLALDIAAHRLTKRGDKVALTPIEFEVLAVLMEAAGRVVPHHTILARVWGAEYVHQRHYLRLYIGYLRSKLEDDVRHPRYIVSERGRGYRIGTGDLRTEIQPDRRLEQVTAAS